MMPDAIRRSTLQALCAAPPSVFEPVDSRGWETTSAQPIRAQLACQPLVSHGPLHRRILTHSTVETIDVLRAHSFPRNPVSRPRKPLFFSLSPFWETPGGPASSGFPATTFLAHTRKPNNDLRCFDGGVLYWQDAHSLDGRTFVIVL